ncbi:cell division protein FtsW [Helicobacter sp. CLO-3]|uniref:FtsW/RodA/SpoVE family cell cycle protein n=1 Tax=unclassified Helicobacter TaxID=2593540 RepID=UPI0008057FAE|nr:MULTISPECIES: FtsW/RodA/SpoVE family cell cycle protein [unclassified Helicobacter]OBV28398.1 cell division protein FtsW [Helicobacter sp. CLO-3]OHU85916.1 cell division protein FtsW [Helicobacter sp. CLO-3]
MADSRADFRLFWYVCALMTIGVVMSYSLSSYTVLLYHYGELHFFAREFVSAIIGILLMWMLAQIAPEKYFLKFGFLLFFLSFIMMLLMPFLPESLATSAGGAKRWIRLPFISIAPSEFFKIGFVFFLAWSFSRKFTTQNKKRTIGQEILVVLPYIAVFLIAVLLIAVMQNDLGQVILLALTLVVMLIAAGGSAGLFGILLLAASVVTTIFITISPHRILRLKLWWANAQDSILALLPQKVGDVLRVDNLPEPYQIYHATNAIYNGGMFGSGLGNGTIKLGFLSEVHTDMVLAGITEEFGFIGLSVCVVLMMLVVFRIFKNANRVQNDVYYLFCVGIAMLIGVSFIMNALGVAGLIPLKGIAVPFLSYGGSSMIANSLAIGLVLSLSQKAQYHKS